MADARLLIDRPMPGAANMARDEALLQTHAASNARPVLRFYAWVPATISLGYFQDHGEYRRLAEPAGFLPVVRRTTGGGAILHDLEITYSIVIPAAHPLVAGRPNHLYVSVHEAIIRAIGHGVRMLGDDDAACDGSTRRGPFFCFARRHGLDVVIEDANGPGGYSKIAGSAQRRTAQAVLQHGSIMLGSRYSQQPVAAWSDVAGAIDFDSAVERLLPEFEKDLGTVWTLDSWREEELAAAEAFECRYSGEAWTVRRER